jgi:phage-related protein
MASVASGVHELRVKDATATIRVFYVTKIAHAIMVFHAFEKRTEKTPEREIRLAQQRLREMTP